MFRTILILVLSVVSVYCSCPSLCASSFRQSLAAMLGNKEEALLAPFHYIMKTEYEPDTVYKKAKWTCVGIHQFDSCLKKCPSTFEKSALLTSLPHWNEYCSLLKAPNKAVLSYFSCERDHLRRVEVRCGQIQMTALESIHAMCRSLENYRKCYVKEPHRCTTDALEIKERIDDSLMITLERLLKMNSGHLQIPARCSHWRRHKLRKTEYPEDTEDDEESSGDVVSANDDESVENIPSTTTSQEIVPEVTTTLAPTTTSVPTTSLVPTTLTPLSETSTLPYIYLEEQAAPAALRIRNSFTTTQETQIQEIDDYYDYDVTHDSCSPSCSQSSEATGVTTATSYHPQMSYTAGSVIPESAVLIPESSTSVTTEPPEVASYRPRLQWEREVVPPKSLPTAMNREKSWEQRELRNSNVSLTSFFSSIFAFMILIGI